MADVSDKEAVAALRAVGIEAGLRDGWLEIPVGNAQALVISADYGASLLYDIVEER